MRRNVQPNYEMRNSLNHLDLNARRAEDLEPQKDEPDLEVPVTPVVPTRSLTKQCPLGSLPEGVKKQIVNSGKSGHANPPYPKGSRLRMHFKAISLIDGTVFDDSRSHPRPMEFLVGKKFKMEIWELALNTMFVGEVSKFLVPKELCFFYPMVAKVLRNAFKPRGGQHSDTGCCAHNMLSGTGYHDLDHLLKEPTNMIFHFELLEVSLPGEFEMDSWYMTDEQKAASISELQEEGNVLYYERQFAQASQKYMEGINRIEQLTNKEMPGSPEMEELLRKKIPLLLNHGMCRQQNRDYYEAIKFNNHALKIEPDNVKGLFRRAQCYKETAHWKEARADFKLALQLDPTLKKAVREELEGLKVSEDCQNAIDKTTCQRMLQQKVVGGVGGAPKHPEKETAREKQRRLVTELLAKTRLEDEAEEREYARQASQPGTSRPKVHFDKNNVEAMKSKSGDTVPTIKSNLKPGHSEPIQSQSSEPIQPQNSEPIQPQNSEQIQPQSSEQIQSQSSEPDQSQNADPK